MSEMKGPQWCTIESDPGVFTELIGKFGVKGVQVEEIWDLEDQTFKNLRGDIYGLVFLFKWDKSAHTSVAEDVIDVPEHLFFAKQMIHNACATQAILSILLNCEDKVDLGGTLSEFRTFTAPLDPESAGLALENSEDIRQAHNSFSRPEPIQIEIAKDEDGEDAFHFISYVPKHEIVYEIDGLQSGPRIIGACEEATWWETARPAIQERMLQYGQKELRFTLLALVRNLKEQYEEEIGSLKDDTSDTAETRRAELQHLIAEEDEKFEKWRKENIRRRHNYFPFIFNLLRILGTNGLLDGMTDRAKDRKLEKIAEREKREAEQKEKEEEPDKGKEQDKEQDKDQDKDGDVEMSDKS